MPTNIPIVFSTDNNYVMPTGVAILSLLESANPSSVYDIYVLINNDVTEDSKSLLRKQVACFHNHTIDFINIGNVFENAFEIRGISVAAYSRLLIPWLLPQYDKVIYSDVDVIFRIDLTDLYNLQMKEEYIAGIPAASIFTSHSYVKHIEKLGLIPGEYINSGFLLVNSKLQRKDNLKTKFLEFAQNKYTYQDQDVINLVCKGRIKHLSPAYCITPAFYYMLSSENNDFRQFYTTSQTLPKIQENYIEIENYKRGNNCILHYAGDKPWNTFTQAWKEWWNTYQRSIFYDSDREIAISRQILKRAPSWRSIASQIKRKLFN